MRGEREKEADRNDWIHSLEREEEEEEGRNGERIYLSIYKRGLGRTPYTTHLLRHNPKKHPQKAYTKGIL